MNPDARIASKVMREFAGMEDVDEVRWHGSTPHDLWGTAQPRPHASNLGARTQPAHTLQTLVHEPQSSRDGNPGSQPTQHALVDFSYYLTIGNMDEAHRAVKLIKNASVWENTAKMCAQTKQL